MVEQIKTGSWGRLEPNLKFKARVLREGRQNLERGKNGSEVF